MKAAVLHAYDVTLKNSELVRYEDVPDPKIEKPTDVVVSIGGAGVCHTDLHIVEGIRRDHVAVRPPYMVGHENAGWVEAIGNSVESVKGGDSVICHPLVTSGHCLACRRGDDMHAGDSSFPGINANGDYAEYLLTGERALIKLPQSLAPKHLAPYTDAGLTAYRAAKKAPRHLRPDALEPLRRYPWPGNVRELRNLVESLPLMVEGEEITVDDLPPELRPTAAGAPAGETRAPEGVPLNLEDGERRTIEEAMRRHEGGNLAQVARTLGISRSTLYRKIERYSIARP